MKKKIAFVILFLFIGCSLLTGTYAVYTKSFPFFGSITKVAATIPPAPEENEDIVNNPNGEKEPDVSVGEGGEVSITRRGDYLKLVDIPGNEYKVEVDISSFKSTHAFGVYVDGYYNEENHKVHADVVQFVNGGLEIKRKSFDRKYDADGNIIVVESTESVHDAIASVADVASVYTEADVANGMHISIIIKTKIGKKGVLVKVPEVYINDKLVPNQKYPEREILHNGKKAYIGYRSWWGGKPNVEFKNLKVSALEALKPEEPDVIIPGVDPGAGGNPDIVVKPEEGEVTIKNVGDYVFAANGIVSDSYVVKVKIQLDANAPDGLTNQLKGFGVYIDGSSTNGTVNTDCLYFTNTGSTEQLNLGSYALVPMQVNGQTVFNRVGLSDDVKVTTQGESSIDWDDMKHGFHLYIAVKTNPSTASKQVRIFTSDKDDKNIGEATAYYDSPWTGLPPIRPLYKVKDRIYVGYHANNADNRFITFNNFTVSNGLDIIPPDILHKFGW